VVPPVVLLSQGKSKGGCRTRRPVVAESRSATHEWIQRRPFHRLMESDDRSNQCKQAQQLRKIADDRQVKSNNTTFNLSEISQRRRCQEWKRRGESKAMRRDRDWERRKVINAREIQYRNFFISLSIANSNVSVDPGLLVLHAQWIGSTVPDNQTRWITNNESESCEDYPTLRSSPSIGIGSCRHASSC
jgi:hypothetical protein